jgi:hypothetical protein
MNSHPYIVQSPILFFFFIWLEQISMVFVVIKVA